VGAVFAFGPVGLAMMGAIVGAFVGAMSGWGVHAERISHYEDLLKQGKSLLIAHGNPADLIVAEQILKETAPVEVHAYARTGSESPEVNPAESARLFGEPARELPSTLTETESKPVFPMENDMMPYENAQQRFKAAIGVLVDEKGPIKDRLLIAFASQLSRI